ncbi:MAG TPA: sugar ABC transporter permease [Cyanobacteria bacterium UBA8156]|jgi:putative chitobiose transport system permease protein|nr:sugar ABC transporter permease [Cyanobacteria bacterium UBA8156]
MKTWGRGLLMGAIALFMVLPLLWLLSTALKSPAENLFQQPPRWWPENPTLVNFQGVWQAVPFLRYTLNSTVVAVGATACHGVLCALTAYPLARMSFVGRRPLFWAIVATSAIPFQVTLLPLYLLATGWGLKNTYLGLMLPYLISPFGIFLLRQALAGVPQELEEAARLDGCSALGIWWDVLLPATLPAQITVALIAFLGVWGDFLWPLALIDNPDRQTLPLAIAQLAGAFGTNWRWVAAGSVLALLPVVALYLVAQRFIVPAETTRGLKG